jgi:hypothetical protein
MGVECDAISGLLHFGEWRWVDALAPGGRRAARDREPFPAICGFLTWDDNVAPVRRKGPTCDAVPMTRLQREPVDLVLLNHAPESASILFRLASGMADVAAVLPEQVLDILALELSDRRRACGAEVQRLLLRRCG